MNITLKHLYSVIGLALLIFIAFGSSDDDDGTGSSTYHKILAYNTASDYYVKPRLKSPSTADFPGSTTKSNHVTLLSDGKFKISSWVDSQNGFGAIVRSNWSCEVTIDKEDNVAISNLIIE